MPLDPPLMMACAGRPLMSPLSTGTVAGKLVQNGGADDRRGWVGKHSRRGYPHGTAGPWSEAV